MDGLPVNTSPLQRLAEYVRQAAIAAGYDVDRVNSGAKAKLAKAAGMSPSTLSRLLLGQRMPDPQYFAPLAKALKVDPLELLDQLSEDRPAEKQAEQPGSPVASQPITPDEVADSWGVDDFGREMVHAMFQRLTSPQPTATASEDDIGGAATQ